MNIKVPDSWLRTFLDTNKDPNFIAKSLSLTGPSVEKVQKVYNDFVYDIEVTTNRPDALSVFGIAREVYANFSFNKIPAQLKKPQAIDTNPILEVSNLPLDIKIEDSKLCPRFSAIIMDNVTISPSPASIQRHLELSGVRALNNIVDISNYIMLELGQPMHTFDYDKILKNKMLLRQSKKNEEITTLDGVKRKLPAGTTVIEDDNRLIDLCGIAGAANSQIDNKTQRILIFVQIYDPQRIRKVTQSLNLRTEASSRFEKGLDPEGIMPALNRAIYLSKQLSGAKVASKIIDIYPTPPKPKTIILTKEKLDTYLGIDFSLDKASSILKNLNFKVKNSPTQIFVQAPSFRTNDIQIEEDLIEEVARIVGFDNLPTQLPQAVVAPIIDPIFYWQEHIKKYLKYQGFSEIYTYSMLSKKDLETCGFDINQVLKIRNPINFDLEYMRPTLLASQLKVIAQNQSRGANLKFFELANIYYLEKDAKPKEKLTLAAIAQADDFYAIKGVLEGLLDDLSINYQFVVKDIPNHQAGQTAQIKSDGMELGDIGKVNPMVTAAFGAENGVFAFSLDFETLTQLAKSTKKYTPISKYPEIAEDISMIVEKDVEVAAILDLLKKNGGKLLEKVEVFDIFYPKDFPTKKSIAIHLTYQSQNHNLTTKEVEIIRKKIILSLENKLKAKIRLKELTKG